MLWRFFLMLVLLEQNEKKLNKLKILQKYNKLVRKTQLTKMGKSLSQYAHNLKTLNVCIKKHLFDLLE